MTQPEPFIMFGWYHQIATFISLLGIFGAWYFAKNAKTESQKQFGTRFLIGCVILLYVWVTGQELRTGKWGLPEGLPLHLCDISAWTMVYALAKKSEFAFELGYYWGMASGIMALLFPEVYFIDIYYAPFFFWHTLLIAIPVFMMYAHGFRPTHRGIYRTLGVTALIALPVGIFVWLIPHANYMFLRNAPLAANILPIPKPPFHIIGIALIGLAVFYALYLPFAKRKDLN